MLDAECAAAGISTVCIAARCEDSPRKGIAIGDAAVLAVSSRVALISMMKTSIQRSRFSSLAETQAFYAQDWGVSEAEVEEIFTVDTRQLSRVADRRKTVAALALSRGIVLATHDDRTEEHIEEAFEYGASVAEFPLSMAAAQRAHTLGITVVLGIPNALRGRSASSGNVLASDAVAAGVCDVLCSDYLPSAMNSAPHVLAREHDVPLTDAIDLASTNPAIALGVATVTIEAGRPLTASLRWVQHFGAGVSEEGVHVGLALWRDGRLVFTRNPSGGTRARALGFRYREDVPAGST